MKAMEIVMPTKLGKVVEIRRACATPAERTLMYKIKLSGLLVYDNLTTGEKRIATQLARMGLVAIKEGK